MEKKLTLRLLRGAVATFALLTTVSVGVGMIANDWSQFLDTTLGTRHTKTVNSSDVDPAERYTYVNEDIKTTDDLVAWHKDLAERMEEEGAVLLKNNGALPLGSGKKITLLGNRSHNPVYGGQIGSSPNGSQNVSLEQALKDKGFSVNPTAIAAYSQATVPGRAANNFGTVKVLPNVLKINEPSVNELKDGIKENKELDWDASIKEYSDAAIVVIGRPSSEAADFYPGVDGLDSSEFEEGSNVLGLSINEKAIIDYACDNFSKVIVLVNSSSAMELDYVENKAGVDSILWVGDPGNYGFLGVADILKGEVSPSGHLPDTYAVDSTSSPAMVNFGLFAYGNYADYAGETDTYKGFAFLDEAEGIYTGYRYYETRYEDQILGRNNATSTTGSSTGSAWNYDDEVTYTFGYGLSYTTFTQEIVPGSYEEKQGKISIKVKVTNTGNYDGKDVVQVYVQTPYTQNDIDNHVEKAAIQLAGFEKTGVLAKNGGTETVTVTFDKKYIASYDYVNAKTYILDAGDYYLSIGNGAHEALNNVLKAKGENVDGDAAKTYKWTQDNINTTAYATSNNFEVTNQLDDMNLNYWKGDKTKPWEGQLSRNDWSGTWPKGYTYSDAIHSTSLTATDAMIKELQNDVFSTSTGNWSSEETKWGQNTGMSIGMMKGAAYDDERWDELLSTITLEEAITFYTNGNSLTMPVDSIYLEGQFLGDGPLGFGSTIKGSNGNELGDPAAVGPNDKNADYRVDDSVLECILGASFNKELWEEFGERIGTDSLWTNKIILWAPGLNTHRTPYNARNHEYPSEDSMLTNYFGAAVTTGSLKYGAIVAPKHFAFNDQETNRTGVSVFMNEQRAREIELRAFQGAFDDAGAMGTMTAFNRAGVRYAGAHHGLMTNILCKEWGFNGYNITDMINGPYYMRADNSLMAGTTILDTTNNSTAVELLEAVKNNNEVQNALKEAMHRNLYVLANSNAMNGIDNLSKTVPVIPWWEATIIAIETVCGVLTGAAVIGYVVFAVLDKKKKNGEVA